jgi:hypothetical protein
MLTRMGDQLVIRLDDAFGAQVRAAAAAAGDTVSGWARSALAQKAALDTALRARAEEDARDPLYTAGQEDALMSARARRGLAAFDDPDLALDVAAETGPAARG